MSHVIIIAGASKGFWDEAVQFERYLKTFPGATVTFIESAYLDDKMLLRKMTRQLRLHEEEPLLIVYNGHGQKEGWQINEDHLLQYEHLALTLLFRRQPTLIVNDCCYAGAITAFLSDAGVDGNMFGVIASVSKNHPCDGGLLQDLEDQWNSGAEFIPAKHTATLFIKEEHKKKRIVISQRRYGQRFDYLFLKKH